MFMELTMKKKHKYKGGGECCGLTWNVTVLRCLNCGRHLDGSDD